MLDIVSVELPASIGWHELFTKTLLKSSTSVVLVAGCLVYAKSRGAVQGILVVKRVGAQFFPRLTQF